jgi:hypothetical protein
VAGVLWSLQNNCIESGFLTITCNPLIYPFLLNWGHDANMSTAHRSLFRPIVYLLVIVRYRKLVGYHTVQLSLSWPIQFVGFTWDTNQRASPIVLGLSTLSPFNNNNNYLNIIYAYCLLYFSEIIGLPSYVLQCTLRLLSVTLC